MVAVNQYLSSARKLCQQAGRRLLSYRGKKQLNYKGGNLKDWVTQVDGLAESAIIRGLLREFPSHCILSEEAGLVGDSGSGYCWFIDPIDGTGNYLKGWPYFAVSIALAFKGRTLLGVVYNPVTNELFYGVRGRGAYLNGKAITVSQHKVMRGGLGVMEFGSKRTSQHKRGLHFFDTMRSSLLKMRLPGCASLDMSYTAAGRADVCVLLDMKLWDVAAACLICEEAGGMVVTLGGKGGTLKADLSAASGTVDVIGGNHWLVQRTQKLLQRN